MFKFIDINQYQNLFFIHRNTSLFIIIFTLLFSQWGNSVELCTHVFRKGQIDLLMMRPESFVKNLNLDKRKTALNAINRFEFIGTDLVQIAYENLQNLNVLVKLINANEMKKSKNKISPYLVIDEQGIHPLNRLANKLKNKWGVRLIYAPEKLGSNTISVYSDNFRVIYLSHFQAVTGAIDFTLLHEVRHAVMTAKEKHERSGEKNLTPMINGNMRALVPYWPWGLSLNHGYSRYMSLQEYHTYKKTYFYRILSVRQKIKAQKLNTLDKIRLSKIDDDRFSLIYRELLRMYDYEIGYLSGKNQGIFEVRGGDLFFADVHLSYVVNFKVPQKFVLFWLNENNIELSINELADFLKHKKNRQIIQELFIDYLISARSQMIKEFKNIEAFKQQTLALLKDKV